MTKNIKRKMMGHLQEHTPVSSWTPSSMCNIKENYLPDVILTQYCYIGPFPTAIEANQQCLDPRYNIHYLDEEDAEGSSEDVGYVCYRQVNYPEETAEDCEKELGVGVKSVDNTCADFGGDDDDEDWDPCEDTAWSGVNLNQCCSSGGSVCPPVDLSTSSMCSVPSAYDGTKHNKWCRIGPRNHVFTEEECPYPFYRDYDKEEGYYCQKKVYTNKEVEECYEKISDLETTGSVDPERCSGLEYHFQKSVAEVGVQKFCKYRRDEDFSICCENNTYVCDSLNDNYYYYYDNSNPDDEGFYPRTEPFVQEDVCCAQTSWEHYDSDTMHVNQGCYIQGENIQKDDCDKIGWEYEPHPDFSQCKKGEDWPLSINACKNGPESQKVTVAEYCQLSDEMIPDDAHAVINCLVSFYYNSNTSDPEKCPKEEGWRYQSQEHHGDQCIKQRHYENHHEDEPHLKCGYGMVHVGDKCVTCPAGTVPYHDRTRCIICEGGTFSLPFEDACRKCEAGTFSLPGETTCRMCPYGTYSSEKASQCLACESGKNSAPGSSSCRQCSANSH